MEKETQAARTKNDYFEQILKGDLDVEVPPNAKIVRIFISSTFTDTEHERNILMKDVYPELDEFCNAKGYEFQVVDMRWGVRDEVTADHKTTEMCLDEIDACNRYSTGPTFVAFLAQKYGYRPIPQKIPAEEFEKLLKAPLAEKETNLLHVWWKCDHNNVPPMYLLQPIYIVIPNYGNKNVSETQQSQARQDWWKQLNRLQLVLRKASKMAFGKTDDKYMISVTEHEIRKGILNLNKPNKHCLWFQRYIDGVSIEADPEHKKRFVDINNEGDLDDEAGQLLHQLKSEKIPKVLSKRNTSAYTISWHADCGDLEKPTCGINPEDSNHAEYLKELCNEFGRKLRKMITEGIREREQLFTDKLIEEIAQHTGTCKDKTDLFHGREEILNAILHYLENRDEINQPLVVHGQSGLGKTSIMAKAFELIKQKYKESVAVIRFLGTTADSSTISRLLYSICCQIKRALNSVTTDIPEEFNKLVAYFKELINPEDNRMETLLGEANIILFIDSIDQLSSDDGAYTMQWLPTKLKRNVKVVISTLTNEGYPIYANLSKVLPVTLFIQIEALPDETANDVLNSWLKKKSRTITKYQREVIMKKFSQCPSPLFLKIAFEEIIRWKSYTVKSKIALETNVKGAINKLFSRLERKHGQKFVSHCLGLLTASRNGLSDVDIQDVISIDDEVLIEVFQYWEPPLCRMPPMLWLRLRKDLRSFITSRGDGGTLVNMWYHRQFIEAARERYLSKDCKKKYHTLLKECFAGDWSRGKEKPFGTTGKNKDRLVSHHPNIFREDTDHPVFNYRKLDELPHHLIHADNLENLKSLFLFNYNFLSTKLRATGYQNLIEDTRKALSAYPDDSDVKMINEALILSASILRNDPDQLPSQLAGRYNHFKGFYTEKLISAAKNSGTPCLYPLKNISKPPEKHFKGVLIGHTKPVSALTLMSDKNKLASVGEDWKLRIWNLESRTEEHCYPIMRTRLNNIFSCADDTCIILVSATDVQYLSVETGAILKVCKSTKHDCDTSQDKTKFVCFDKDACSVTVFHCGNGCLKLQNSIQLVKVYSENKCFVAAGTSSYVHIAHKLTVNKLQYTLCARKLTNSEIITHLLLKSDVDSIAFTPKGDRLIILHTQDALVYTTVYNAITWNVIATYNSPGRIGSKFSVYVCQLFSGTEMIWSTKNAIHFWNVDTGARRSLLEAKIFTYGQISATDNGMLLAAQNNAIAIYDLQLIKKFEQPNDVGSRLDGKTKLGIKQCFFNLSLGLAVTAVESDAICVWDINTGSGTRAVKLKGVQLGKILSIDEKYILIYNNNNIFSYDYWKNRSMVVIRATIGHYIREDAAELYVMEVKGNLKQLAVYNYQTGDCIHNLEINLPGHYESNNLEWFSSADSHHIVLRSGCMYVSLDTTSKRITGVNEMQKGCLKDVIMSNDKPLLLMKSENDNFYVKDIKMKSETKEILFTNKSTYVASSSNGKLVLTDQCHQLKSSFSIYSMKNQSKISEYYFSQENILNPIGKFSRNGKLLMMSFTNPYHHYFVLTFDTSFESSKEMKCLGKLSLGYLTPKDISIRDNGDVCLCIKELDGIHVFRHCGNSKK